jgi:hypothetical protein
MDVLRAEGIKISEKAKHMLPPLERPLAAPVFWINHNDKDKVSF